MNATPQPSRLLLASLMLSSFLLLACDRTPANNAEQSDPGVPSVQPPVQPITLSNASVMQVLPGKSITSGYFDLHNNLPHAVELVGASSSAVGNIEMHEMVQDGNNMQMRRLNTVRVEADTTLKFAKGGKHLMLFGVNELPEDLSITLKFADGRETAATFKQQRW